MRRLDVRTGDLRFVADVDESQADALISGADLVGEDGRIIKSKSWPISLCNYCRRDIYLEGGRWFNASGRDTCPVRPGMEDHLVTVAERMSPDLAPCCSTPEANQSPSPASLRDGLEMLQQVVPLITQLGYDPEPMIRTALGYMGLNPVPTARTRCAGDSTGSCGC